MIQVVARAVVLADYLGARKCFSGRPEFRVVDGFYLNVHGKNFVMARISYFVSRSDNAKRFPFSEFFKRNDIIEVKQHESPREIILAQNYGGPKYEQRHRNSLVNETQIGRELLKGDLLQARILFAIYRWQVKKARLPTREYLEPTFKRHSPTYNSMSEEEKVQFFADSTPCASAMMKNL